MRYLDSSIIIEMTEQEDWGNGEEIDYHDDDDDDDYGIVDNGDDESSEGRMQDSDEVESGDDDDDDQMVEDEIVVEKFIRTFNNGNYDAEFDDAFSLDRTIMDRTIMTYRVRPTQASYNKPINWRERNRMGLERVKEQLQTCIDSVSDDKTFNLQLIHKSDGHQLMDNEEPIVWHEPILHEYWDRLEAKINQITPMQLVIANIEIVNVEITKE